MSNLYPYLEAVPCVEKIGQESSSNETSPWRSHCTFPVDGPPVFACSEAAIAKCGSFSLVGKIEAIDAATGTATVHVLKGNKLVQPYLDQSGMLQTAAIMRYLYKATASAVAPPIAFSDLNAGDLVSVNGTFAKGIWAVACLTIGVKLSCFPWNISSSR